MRSQGAARSCCWPARPGSARRAWPRRSRRRAMRCAARGGEPGGDAALRPDAGRAARLPARRARRAGLVRARSRGTSRCCCPSSATAVAESDRATLFEALRCALATIAAGAPAVDPARRPAVVRRRDPRAARRARRSRCASCPMLVVGAYRSDEVPRAHPLRGLRNELRRARPAARARARAAGCRRDGGADRRGPRHAALQAR